MFLLCGEKWQKGAFNNAVVKLLRTVFGTSRHYNIAGNMSMHTHTHTNMHTHTRTHTRTHTHTHTHTLSQFDRIISISDQRLVLKKKKGWGGGGRESKGEVFQT